MATLFCFGIGYTARRFIADGADGFDCIGGTVRERESAARLTREGIGSRPVDAVAFDGAAALPDAEERLAAADGLLVSVPPDAQGDPVLRHHAEAIARSRRLPMVVYLSTIGVYGDHGGAWVDETTEAAPGSDRGRARLAAEQAWTALAAGSGKRLAILRLAGIYGPGRNAFLQLAGPAARRVVKPGQVFNRVHVADIAQAIAASFARQANGVFNVSDDEPAPPDAPISFAAELLGREPPPEIPFAQAAGTMSAMALSFYRESRRVRNDRMKRELGVRLHYPSYREGLRALLAEREGASLGA